MTISKLETYHLKLINKIHPEVIYHQDCSQENYLCTNDNSKLNMIAHKEVRDIIHVYPQMKQSINCDFCEEKHSLPIFSSLLFILLSSKHISSFKNDINFLHIYDYHYQLKKYNFSSDIVVEFNQLMLKQLNEVETLAKSRDVKLKLITNSTIEKILLFK